MSITTGNMSIEEEDNLLDEYIKSLKEIVLEFKENNIHNKKTKDNVIVSFLIKNYQFFAEYIFLEDEILKLILLLGKNEANLEIIEKHINNFNPYWKDFQDEWSEKNW